MPSEDSIRTDASTVHRSPGDSPPLAGATSDPVADEYLAEAQTVIRGSSRGQAEGSKPSQIDRTPAAVAKVLLGQRLNHFLLEELIGGGGMGAVFRARDERLDRTVAIKVIPFVGEDADLKRRFRNEAQSAARLDHPHIARVFEVGSQDDWHYIVFEYVRGINVRDKVAGEGVMSIDDAVFATCQLAEAIQHSADRGIVHRDIKPSNVLIGEDDQIKLVDMGLARSESLELSEDMTASGVTLGTFDYISPEQARDPRDADVRSDIYSLGCTLYYMLTGRPPFPGGTMLQKLLSHGNSPPPDARLLRPEISDDLMAVIRKMLAKAPENRYQNALDLVLDLKQVAVRENLPRSRAVAAVAVAEPSRLVLWLEHHAPWLVAASLLLLSAGWLQLNSTISRDAFNLPVPEVASVVESTRSDESGADADLGESGLDDSSGPPLPARDSAASTGDDELESLADRTFPSPETAGDQVTRPAAVSPWPAVATEVELPALPIRPPLAALEESSAVDLPPEATGNVAVERAAAERIERVRVVAANGALDPSSAEPGVAVAETLPEAMRVARREGVNRIEIAVPELRSRPVELLQEDLTIVSAVEGGSTLVFESEDELSMQRSTMLRVGATRASFENLHFVWRVPVGEVDGGAMFALNSDGLVRMNGCTVTVENASRRDEIYAFDVITDPEAIDPSLRDGGSSGAEGELPLVAIELQDVVIRGEMTMVHMDFAAELQLRWANGLLAVSRRMIDTAGALDRPAEAAGPIQLSLEQLTAWIPEGVLRMRLGVSGPYPVPVDREAVNCVFVVDADRPHIELSGLESLEADRSLLTVRGEANAYDASPTLDDPFLVRSDMMGRRETVRLIDLLADAPLPPAWWDEQSPRWTVRWTKIDLPNVAPSTLTPSDFRQDGILVRGFDEQALPELPSVSRNASEPEEVSQRATGQSY